MQSELPLLVGVIAPSFVDYRPPTKQSVIALVNGRANKSADAPRYKPRSLSRRTRELAQYRFLDPDYRTYPSDLSVCSCSGLSSLWSPGLYSTAISWCSSHRHSSRRVYFFTNSG